MNPYSTQLPYYAPQPGYNYGYPSPWFGAQNYENPQTAPTPQSIYPFINRLLSRFVNRLLSRFVNRLLSRFVNRLLSRFVNRLLSIWTTTATTFILMSRGNPEE
jgi:hypothetical protein